MHQSIITLIAINILVIFHLREYKSVPTTDCDQFIMIRHLQKRDLEFADDHNRYWQYSSCWNPGRSSVMVHCFIQNNHNYTPSRSFIDTETVLYWYIQFFTKYQIQNQQVFYTLILLVRNGYRLITK